MNRPETGAQHFLLWQQPATTPEARQILPRLTTPSRAAMPLLTLSRSKHQR